MDSGWQCLWPGKATAQFADAYAGGDTDDADDDNDNNDLGWPCLQSEKAPGRAPESLFLSPPIWNVELEEVGRLLTFAFLFTFTFTFLGPNFE